jgi:hypothetical protein
LNSLVVLTVSEVADESSQGYQGWLDFRHASHTSLIYFAYAMFLMLDPIACHTYNPIKYFTLRIGADVQ